MGSSPSATQVAFLLVALIQAVFAAVWAIGAYALRASRPAILYWIAWSGLSALTWLVLSIHVEQPPMLAVLAGVIAVMALQRGIRSFIGRAQPDRLHAVLLVFVAVLSWFEFPDERRWLQAVGNYGVIATLYLGIARDLHTHARDQLRFRMPILLALPVLLGAAAFLARVVRAVVEPQSVLAEMAADSLMNVRAAMIFVALVLSLHATLLVLVVARLVNALQRLSRHDGLTGLLNRRAMEELLEEHTARARAGNAAFVLMMLDLDHFKRINDRHGHPTGDRALRHVAELLGKAMPPAARLARYGGEEFVVLFRGSLREAGELAERLRELLADQPLSHDAGPIPLSVSIGVAQWRNPDDLSQLLLRADGALFQAKVQGRNRVVVAVETLAA